MARNTAVDFPRALSPRDGDGVPSLTLAPAESAALGALVDGLLDESGTALEHRLDRLAVAAHDAPERLRSTLSEFRLTGRPYGGLVLSGLPIDENAVGATPTSYSTSPQGREVDRAGALLLLLGSLLGDPFSFLSQQRGRLVLDVFPVRGHERSQLGSSSTVNLEWHNEDAFHPYRADWIMLLCLRNPDQVPTTFAPVQDLDIDPAVVNALHQKRFVILPDESHTEEFNKSTTGLDEAEWVRKAFAQIAEMNQAPRRIPILSGDHRAPFVRIDPAFMLRDLGDAEAERALAIVIEAIDRRLADVVLAPGELLIIDNKRAVHGRRPFRARHDGTDRWLRRINVTADLRQSAHRRYGDHGRALA